jgi:hypothetical protein
MEVRINVKNGYVKGRKFTFPISLTDHLTVQDVSHFVLPSRHSPGHSMTVAVCKATTKTHNACDMLIIYTANLVLSEQSVATFPEKILQHDSSNYYYCYCYYGFKKLE